VECHTRTAGEPVNRVSASEEPSSQEKSRERPVAASKRTEPLSGCESNVRAALHPTDSQEDLIDSEVQALARVLRIHGQDLFEA
jgi:hypothetical protein